jgi:two-component system chemotaxis response regulator CheY
VFNLKTRVLVVDDMSTMRSLVVDVCRQIGFTDIVEADNGASAFLEIQNSETPIGLVISDWNMPQSSGLDLVKRVRADSRFKNLPFVMVSTESKTENVMEALKAGVDHYVMKPFTAAVLTEKLELTHKKRGG